jgi:hypothetical protein
MQNWEERIFSNRQLEVSLHQDSNNNGVRTVNIATSKYLINSTMFFRRNIPKYIWTPPDEKNHNQIDHILIDGRWHFSTLDIQSFKKADRDSDHYLAVAKFRERCAVINMQHRGLMEKYLISES